MLTSELQVFLVAAETENFSETGRRLGLSQPAVSMQIKSLEATLGVELFRRSGRRVSLTEAGHALIPMARDMAHRAVRLQEAMASIHGDVAGNLEIACTTTAGKYVLPQLMAQLLNMHPLVDLSCLVVSRPAALELLREGRAHIGVASMRVEEKDLEYRAFLTDRIVLVTAPDHPWARRAEPIRPAELAGERFILRENTSGTHVALTEGLAWHDLSIDDLSPRMTLGNAEAIRMSVETGVGVAFVSMLVAGEGVQRGSLAIVPVEGMELTKTLYMIRNPDRPATRAQAAFWELAFSGEAAEIRDAASAPPTGSPVAGS